MLFGTVVYNIWTKRVGDLDYESINFCSKVRYTIVPAAAHLRKGAGTAAGRMQTWSRISARNRAGNALW